MRGKVKFKTDLFSFSRITPAYAGKRKWRLGTLSCTEDHPRLCGEKTPTMRNRPVGIGSPPPMRGKGCFSKVCYISIRITPAYAGKRMLTVKKNTLTEDHPRLCGEKATRQQRKVKKIGSPPPMRGKVSQYKNMKQMCKDHPRLCGEKRKIVDHTVT